MDETPKRRWYRKKRWWAAAAVWLVIAYPVSLGPACYAVGRGWVGQHSVGLVYDPIYNDWTNGYGEWCYHLGRAHASD